MADLNTAQIMQIGKHEIGAKSLCYIQDSNLLISGGWDGMMKFWDLRQQDPCLTLNLQRKILSMSMTYPLLVVAQSDRVLSYYNLNKLSSNFREEISFESHLKYATTTVSCFNEPNGYVIGSIEGRTAVKNIDLQNTPTLSKDTKVLTKENDYAFRCHRTGEGSTEVYPVNTIAFNQVYGTFCTGGGDGSWILWDKESKTKLKTGTIQTKAPITSIDYSYDGNLLAYAYGYDWHKGLSFEGAYKTGINIHYLPDVEKKRKSQLK